jgi:hypothetical protein
LRGGLKKIEMKQTGQVKNNRDFINFYKYSNQFLLKKSTICIALSITLFPGFTRVVARAMVHTARSFFFHNPWRPILGSIKYIFKNLLKNHYT